MAIKIIENGYIITMDKDRRVIEKGSVVLQGNKIIDVGKSSKIRRKNYQPEAVIDATRKAVLPGFINTHTHLYQILLRCMGDDTALIPWIADKIHEPHIVNLKPKDLYYAAATGFIEAIKTGTTSTQEMQYISADPKMTEEVFKAARDVGNRAIICKTVHDIDRFNYYGENLRTTLVPIDKGIKDFLDIHKKWHMACNGRLYAWGGPDWPPACSEEALKEYTDLALELKIRFPFHLSESKPDERTFQKAMGKSQTAWLYENCPQMGEVLFGVHCVWLSNKDVDIFAKTNTAVSHNTTSNCYLGDGIAPIPQMLKKNVTVSLGVDGPASNCTQDLWDCMRWTALVHKGINYDPTVIRAETVLEMATIDGAKTLGLENEIGSIETGKKADLILVDLSGINFTPLNRIISQLVYCGYGRDVHTVLVDGKLVMENRRLTTISEELIKKQTQQSADKLIERSGTEGERSRSWNE